MKTFSEYRANLQEGVGVKLPAIPKISGGAYPAHMSAGARARALRHKWQGELKAAQRAAAQRLIQRQKKAGVAVKPEINSLSDGK